MNHKLIDQHGRHIHKLRLSLLDACNFRCRYCMPKAPKFMPFDKLMKRKEIKRLLEILIGLGFDEVRLTGGEPTLRNDLLDILRDLSEIVDLNKLGLTTNGYDLAGHLPEFKKTKCQYLNISLDSLNRLGFLKMTGRDFLENVLESIFMAKELNFHVKINVVLMKGINDFEIEEFIKFSGKYDIEVRFLELMRIGVAREYHEKHFVSVEETLIRLKEFSSLVPISLPLDSTSFNFKLSNGANIGLIASESGPFCKGCSRLRLSAEGTLRPCLMMNEGYSLINKSAEEVQDILLKTMSLKPTDRIYEVEQSMNEIGG